jgi:hypothetical protein
MTSCVPKEPLDFLQFACTQSFKHYQIITCIALLLTIHVCIKDDQQVCLFFLCTITNDSIN